MGAAGTLFDMWKMRWHLDEGTTINGPIQRFENILDGGWSHYFEELKHGANTEMASIHEVKVSPNFSNLAHARELYQLIPELKNSRIGSYDRIPVSLDAGLQQDTLALLFNPYDPANFQDYPLRR